MDHKKPYPKSNVTVVIDDGPHRASVTVQEFDRWVIESINVTGIPQIRVTDESFETSKDAIAHARKELRQRLG
jgi:hypothetical protein